MRSNTQFVPAPLTLDRRVRAAVSNRLFNFHADCNRAVSAAVQAIMGGADTEAELTLFRAAVRAAMQKHVGEEENRVEEKSRLKPAR